MTKPEPYVGPHINPGDYVDIVNEAGMTVGRCRYWPIPNPEGDPLPKQQAIDDGMRGYLSVIDRIMRNDALAAETALRAELVSKVRAAIFADTDAWTSSDIERMAEIAVDTFATFIRAAQ